MAIELLYCISEVRMMNYKMQPSPMSGTRASYFLPLANREDAKFFRSWLVYDSDLDATRTRGRLNWNMVASLALMAVISAGGWFGIGMLARYLVK